jgi:hypothetical protein
MATLDDVVNAIKELKNSMPSGGSQGPVSADQRAEREKAAKENLQRIETQIQANIAMAETEEDLLKVENLKIEALRAAQQVTQNLNISEDERRKRLKKYEERIIKSTKNIKKATEANQEYAGAIDSVQEALATVTGVSKDFSKSLLGQIQAIAKNEKSMEEFGKKLEKQFSKASVSYATFLKTMQLSSAGIASTYSRLENGTVALARAGAMAGRYGSAVGKISRDFAATGVVAEDISRSLVTLAQSFPLAEVRGNVVEIAKEFALFEKFGVSAQSSAMAFSSLNRQIGLTEQDSLDTLNRVAALGVQIGVGAGKMTDDFAAALPRLAIYGNNATKIFGNIAYSASKLGLEVGDVINLAEGFQTFEGSAQAAGKLNAILGGGFIDNLALMEASFEDPTKAAMMIKDAFASAGMSVSSMGPAALKAAAAASGFSDVGKFRSFLEGNLDAADALGGNQLTAQLDAVKEAKAANTFLDGMYNQLRYISDQLFGPVVQPALEAGRKALGMDESATMGKTGLTISGLSTPAIVGAAKASKSALDAARGTGNALSFQGVKAGGKELAKGALRGMGGPLARVAPIIGTIPFGKDIYDMYNSYRAGGVDAIKAEDAIPAITGIIGAAAGGILGSAGGPVGIGLGAATGAGLGNLLGDLSMLAYKTFASPADSSMAQPGAQAAAQQRKLTEQLAQQAGNRPTAAVTVKLVQEEDNLKRFMTGVVEETMVG